MSRWVRRQFRRVSGWSTIIAILLSPSPLPAAKSAPDSTRAAPPVEIRLPPDLTYERGVSADSVVTFSHDTHAAFAGNTCTGCHPKPFAMLHPTRRTSHVIMNAGGSCGTCHDGKQAFGVRDSVSCSTCHAGRASPRMAVQDSTRQKASPAAARKLPAAHVYPSGEDSPGRVTFRHETHTKRGERCAGCHPRPFSMRPSPPRPGGGMHEEAACGACHDGSRSFGAEDPASCGRCHVQTGAPP